MLTGFEMEKPEIRENAIRERSLLEDEEVHRKSNAICARLLSIPEIENARAVMLYSSIGNEVQTGPAIHILKSKKIIALPRMEPGKIIAAALDEKGLSQGGHGIMEPLGNEMSYDEIDAVVVPVVAFDAGCNRIGRGLGHYDRFLKQAKAFKIGLAFDCQETDSIPVESHDVQLDMVITETRVVSK